MHCTLYKAPIYLGYHNTPTLAHSAPILSSSIVPSHSQKNACDLQKKNLIKESWLVLPLLSRGNAHIVHPSVTAVWIVWQVLGWQQSPKLFSEVVTGFYRHYFVLCKVFLLKKCAYSDFKIVACGFSGIAVCSLQCVSTATHHWISFMWLGTPQSVIPTPLGRLRR